MGLKSLCFIHSNPQICIFLPEKWHFVKALEGNRKKRAPPDHEITKYRKVTCYSCTTVVTGPPHRLRYRKDRKEEGYTH